MLIYSLAALPLRLEGKGLENVAYSTCTHWNYGAESLSTVKVLFDNYHHM